MDFTLAARLHPRVDAAQVEFHIATGDVVEKFSTLLAAGTPPGLASMDASQGTGQGTGYADRSDLTPLDDLIKRDRYDLAD